MKKLTIFLAFLLFVGFTVQAQMQISGTVTGAEDGLSIPGVSVVVKDNPTIGTTTDMDGKYTLTVPSSAQVLVFSFVGMKTVEEQIGGRSVINVTMSLETVGLDEIIVLGYSTKGKNSITGSTIQVKSDAIKDVPVVSIDQTLQGKVAGLAISSSSGTPGSIQDIRIRGVGSYTATNQPLIVVDGVPVVSGDFSGDGAARSTLSALATLNNSDVETITVLKDASATAAYGARGSNGVIVITTKKGKVGKTQFNLTSYYGFQNKASQGRDVLTGEQRAELMFESVLNTYFNETEDIYGFGYTRAEVIDFSRDLLDITGEYDAWDAAGRPNVNWEEAMANENAPAININLSASGGDETSNFYGSLGYNETESIILGSSFRRINGALNYNRSLTKNLKLSTTNSVSNTLQDGIILEQAAYFANPILAKYFMSPWFEPYDEDGEPAQTPNPYNYLYLKDYDITYNDLTRLTSNSYLEWEIIKNLKFKTLFGIDYMTISYKNHQNKNYADQLQEGGSTYQKETTNYNLVTQNSLSYNYTMDDHNIGVMALIEYQKNENSYLDGYGENFTVNGLSNISTAPSNNDANSELTDWYNTSYLGMLNYSYLGKYIFDATYRREGSSRFAPDHRFGNFWSVGAAWNLTQENFMSSLSFVDNLRLRASYGESGNAAIDLNSYMTLIYFDADYADAGAMYTVNVGNDELTWEKNRTVDAGLDFAFLQNMISGSVSYFNKKTFDLLQAVPLSATLGHNSDLRNVGEVVNKGIEAILNFNIIQKKDFNLSLSVNFATLDNEVVELAKYADGTDITIKTGTTKLEVGQPIRAWHMRKWAGVDPETGMPQWYLNGKDGEVTTSYYTAAEEYQGGSAIPTYTGGGSLHVDFKGIYFDANVYFAGGHKVYEDWSFYTHHSGYYTTYLYQGVADLMDRWQEPGDKTDYPKQVFDGTGMNASRTSTRFLYDGDYIRLKDLVLGYNLPKNLISKVKLDGASIYVRGTNLFTYVFDEGLKYDPEVRADGFTRLTNPPVKSISVGLNLNF